jgi:hypothetical protein
MATPTYFLAFRIAHLGLFRVSYQPLGPFQSDIPPNNTRMVVAHDTCGTFHHTLHQSQKFPTQ